jgi:hypothetical protein
MTFERATPRAYLPCVVTCTGICSSDFADDRGCQVVLLDTVETECHVGLKVFKHEMPGRRPFVAEETLGITERIVEDEHGVPGAASMAEPLRNEQE